MAEELIIISLTDKAKQQIEAIVAAQDSDTKKGVRVGVIGGGCSGLSYKIDFDEKKDNDTVIELENAVVLIDPKSSIYLKDTVLDFEDGLKGKGFVFKNPNATNTCGCGESFSI